MASTVSLTNSSPAAEASREGEPAAHGRWRPEGRRARLVVGGVAVTAAVALGGASLVNAFFTSQATVDGQQVGTATIEVSATTATGSTPIDAGALLPGDEVSTVVRVENTGTAGIYYTVSLPLADDGDNDLEAALQATVTVEGGDGVIVTEIRSLTAWQSGVLQIDEALAAEATHEVTVTIELPLGAADGDLQGVETGFAVQMDAIQERHTEEPTAGWVETTP